MRTAAWSCSGYHEGDTCDPAPDVSPHLSLSSTLLTAGAVLPGQTVQFTLVPHNDGPSAVGSSWSVSDRLPDGLSLAAASGGDAYDCTGTPASPADVTCVARAALTPRADGAPVIVTATVDPGARGSLRNDTWVAPAGATGADDNNVVHVDVVVAPARPGVTVVRQVAKTVDVDKDGSLDANDEILYAFKVTNTGNVRVTGVVVQDDALLRHHITVACPTDVLAAGASLTCRASAPYRISRADLRGRGRAASRPTP